MVALDTLGLSIPSSSSSSSSSFHARLVLVHIPKTGGTAIQAWGRANKLSLETAHALHCNSTLKHLDARGLTPGAVSMRHCTNRYAASAADPNEVGFCVIRDPLARAVSTYNMRLFLRNSSSCHPLHLAGGIDRILSRGDPDNHDVAQSAFARHCQFKLCFESLGRGMDELVSRTVRLVSSSSGIQRAVPLNHSGRLVSAFSSLPMVRPWRWTMPSNRGHSDCNESHLLEPTIAKLRRFYGDDFELHRAVCSRSSVKSRPDDDAIVAHQATVRMM